MPFCTSCGRELVPAQKFCTHCGAPVESVHLPPSPQATIPHPRQPAEPESPVATASQPVSSPAKGTAGEPPAPARPEAAGMPAARTAPGKTGRGVVLAGAAVLFVAAIAVVFLQYPGILTAGGAGSPVTPSVTAAETTAAPPPQATVGTTVPTPPPDPFPGAFPLRKWFEYNEGQYRSKATVYRYWINGTYRWHNDADNRYYTQVPKAGSKYLFVYVVIVNEGTTAYPYPKSNNIAVHYGGARYHTDPSHYIPNKAGDRDARAIGILEVQQQSDYFNSEFVEDYGLSHGTTSDFIYPGQSNAIDGYLIYEVPASLVPDKTWVEIQFDGDDAAAWKLA